MHNKCINLCKNITTQIIQTVLIRLYGNNEKHTLRSIIFKTTAFVNFHPDSNSITVKYS